MATALDGPPCHLRLAMLCHRMRQREQISGAERLTAQGDRNRSTECHRKRGGDLCALRRALPGRTKRRKQRRRWRPRRLRRRRAAPGAPRRARAPTPAPCRRKREGAAWPAALSFRCPVPRYLRMDIFLAVTATWALLWAHP